MPMDDLFQALNMFKTGVNQLQTSRVIQGANDQVQQIRASEASEADKRNQLTALSHQLVGQMGALGAPVDQIQQQAANVAPKQFGNSNAMNEEALLSGNKQLGSLAQQQQGFEQNPEYKKELLKAKMANMNPLALAKFQEQQDEFNQRRLATFNQEVDPSRASSRTVFGQGATALQKAGRVDALLGDPNKINNISDSEMTLAAEGLTAMTKGGVATKEEIESLLPRTAGSVESRLKQFFGNNPSPAERQGFVQRYRDMIDRENSVNKIDTISDIMDRANGYTKLAARDPAVARQMQLTLASHLAGQGLAVKPEDIQIDPTKGFVVPKLEAAKEAADLNSTLVRKAMGVLQSPSTNPPDHVQKAAKFLQQFGVTPDTAPSRASQIVKRKTMLKVFE